MIAGRDAGIPRTSNWTMSGAKRRLESIDLEDSEDKISDLPDNLIDLILDKLPVAEVVRTSVLTTRWKPCWRRMRKLVLDESFFDQFTQPLEFKFSSLVGSLLVRLFGPIDEFILHVPSSVFLSTIHLIPPSGLYFCQEMG
ncbi:hypothetical protein QQ045_016231 [Rhodiola kirilowii]